MNAGHAILPPSAADRWMNCHGYYEATKGVVSKPSIYAQDGSAAHEILEMALRLDVSPFKLVHNIELADNLALVTEWLATYRRTRPIEDYLIEEWLEWGKAVGYPDLGGTTDLSVIAPGELVVGDYKHGAGVVVEPTDSEQLRLYLLGLINKYGRRKEYRLIIFQPRARHEDGPIREYKIDQAEIAEFTKRVKFAIAQNLEGKGKRKAGRHCRWCPVAGKCKELARYSLEIAAKEFRRS